MYIVGNGQGIAASAQTTPCKGSIPMNRRRSILGWWSIFALLLALSYTPHSPALTNSGLAKANGAAEEIIPAERRIDWSNSGIPGGIPERTNI